MVYKWLHEKDGVTDETCQPYQAKSHECTAENECRDCQHNGKCHAVVTPAKYKVEQYGFVRGETPMMAEIQKRGPISCRQAVTKAFFAYKGGIFKDTSGDTKPRHATSLLGWGTTAAGEKYWVARNSWGTFWGETGYFKILRGVNQLGIEDECSWGVPSSTGVIKKSEERLMGQFDKLVTNQDLGAGIGGTESFVQNDATANESIDSIKPDTAEPTNFEPLPVVTAEDDHSDAFFNQNADVKSTPTDGHAVQPMIADADESFRKQQRAEGVQQ